MVLEKILNKTIHDLQSGHFAQMDVGGHIVTLRILDNADKISLSCSVYLGENYIPKSVRKALSQQVPCAHSPLRTFFTIDEANYRIDIHYMGPFEGVDKQSFNSLIETYAWIAEEWRLILDENDRNDLVYSHRPR